MDPGLTLEDRDLQERYLNSRFYSERFAHLQITWGKQTGKILLPLGRTCVGQTEIEGPLIDVLGNCKIQAPLNGQPPLRGLLLGFTDLERSSVRLDDLLSNEFPARPSSDKATAMLEEMVTRLHRCGVCRPNLSPANIRLINVGNRPSSQGSDHEEDFAHLGSNGSHMAGGFTDSISTSVVDSPESMELDHAQAADSEQHFEVVSLIGSTKWCREGERLDMQELQKLKEQIGVSRFFAITSLQ